MIATPETDAAVIASGGDWSPVLRAVSQRLERERDEARKALKKCREDSICYAEHMRKCGYAEAYKESKENADMAERILEETK